jgi:hypothetical protein
MKHTICTIALMLFSFFSYAQKASIVWGENLKIKKGTTEMNIITADNTGVYVQEEDFRPVMFTHVDNLLKIKFRKFDKDYNEIFERDYNDELKGKDFNRIISFKDRLYLFADDYDKKAKQFISYAVELDKSSGRMLGKLKEIAVIPREDKDERYDFIVVPSVDSSAMVMVADISNKEYARVKVLLMNERLEPVSNTDINLSFARNTYVMDDVLYTRDKKIVVTGRVFEEVQETKKRTKKVFKRVSLEKFGLDGKKEAEFPTTTGGRMLLSAKVVTNGKGDIFVCGYYTNSIKDQMINGIVVNRINPLTGEVLMSSEKEITASMASKYKDDDNEETDKKGKSKNQEPEGESEGFAYSYRFKKVLVGQDNSIILIAEQFQFDVRTSYQSGMVNGVYQTRTTTTFYYSTGDIMTTRIGSDGNIKFVIVIPKWQVERTSSTNSSMGTGISFSSSIFVRGGMPFYSSFNCIPYKNKLFFFYNDHADNGAVTQPGQSAKRVLNFAKSDCYSVMLDLETGKVTRKMLFTNEEEPTAMVRHGMVLNNELYVVALRRAMMGKSTIKLGRILVK